MKTELHLGHKKGSIHVDNGLVFISSVHSFDGPLLSMVLTHNARFGQRKVPFNQQNFPASIKDFSDKTQGTEQPQVHFGEIYGSHQN